MPHYRSFLSSVAAVSAREKDRRKAEVRVSRVAREWTATFDSMPELISITDRSFRLNRVNMALARFAGLKPRDLIGKKCYEVVHRSRRPWPGCPHLKAIRRKRSVTSEINDPNVGFPLLVTCSPFYDLDGSLLGTVHVARNISSQKEAERSRERLIAELREALSKVKQLSGFLPICASCKKIRDDEGYWKQVEVYIRDHSEAEFSHGICPGCAERLYPDLAG